MKLTAKCVPYSSTVGGGLILTDEQGRARFIVNFMGTTEGITREETMTLAKQFATLIEQHGLTVPDREDKSNRRCLGSCEHCGDIVYASRSCPEQTHPDCSVGKDLKFFKVKSA